MYEKTLKIGTAKVNNAYEWQKVRYRLFYTNPNIQNLGNVIWFMVF